VWCLPCEPGWESKRRAADALILVDSHLSQQDQAKIAHGNADKLLCLSA
jgi:hypothetical protein